MCFPIPTDSPQTAEGLVNCCCLARSGRLEGHRSTGLSPMNLKSIYRAVRNGVCVAWGTWRLPGIPKRRLLAVIPRNIRLCRQGQFHWVEVFYLGLLRPDATQAQWDRTVSRKRLTKLQEALNPAATAPTFRDKSRFREFCREHELPCPAVLAVYDGGNDLVYVPTDGGRKAVDLPETFLVESLPDEFVIKPTVGRGGYGLNVFTRTAGGFKDAQGQGYSAATLLVELRRIGAVGALVEEVIAHGQLFL